VRPIEIVRSFACSRPGCASLQASAAPPHALAPLPVAIPRTADRQLTGSHGRVSKRMVAGTGTVDVAFSARSNGRNGSQDPLSRSGVARHAPASCDPIESGASVENARPNLDPSNAIPDRKTLIDAMPMSAPGSRQCGQNGNGRSELCTAVGLWGKEPAQTWRRRRSKKHHGCAAAGSFAVAGTRIDSSALASCGSFTLNSILASCSGANPILRRNGSQRGSLCKLANVR